MASELRRAAIYVRVSTAVQEAEGSSLGTQEAACRRYAATHGYRLEDTHVYRETHTGTELWERDVLAALRDAVRHGEIDVVIAFAIDRLARDPVHLGVILSEADHHGVVVEFVSEPLDDSPEGQLIRFVKGYAAKIEHTKIKERSIRGRRARAESGKMMPGQRPKYGYQWADDDKTRLVVDAVTGPIVKRMVRDAVAGKGLRKIAADLSSDGIPTPTGGPRWGTSTVHMILSDVAYTGRAYAYRRSREGKARGASLPRWRPVEESVALPAGTVPALVDEETFETIQARLRQNQAESTRNNSHPEATLLRGGLVRCGYCGAAMSAVHPGDPKANYRCAHYLATAHAAEGITQPAMRVSLLDAFTWGRVVAVLTHPDTVARELEKMRDADPGVADLAAVDRQLAQVDKKRRALIANLEDLDPDTAGEVRQRLAALAGQRRGLEEERETVLQRRWSFEAAKKRVGELETWCRSVSARLDTLSYDEKRTALDALGVQVRVYAAGHSPRFEVEMAIPMDSDIVSTTSLCGTS